LTHAEQPFTRVCTRPRIPAAAMPAVLAVKWTVRGCGLAGQWDIRFGTSDAVAGSAGGVAFPDLGDKGLDGGEGEVRAVAEDGVTRPGKSHEAGGAGRQLAG